MRRFVIATAFGSLAALACTPPPPAQPADATPANQATDTPTTEQTEAEAPEAPAEPEVSQENLPPAEDVLAKSVEAAGGREAIEKLKSFYQESKMEIKAQNMTASTKTWYKGGNFYSETDMPGMGMIRVWRNKDGIWNDDPINGMRKLEGAEAEQAERDASLLLVADWKEHFESAETTKRRKAGDATLVDVVMTTPSGEEITMSFDENEGLLREKSFKQKSPAGELPVTVRLEEYEEQAGIKMPQRTVMDMKVAEAVTTVEKFEPNVKISDKKFKPDKKAAGKKKKAPKGTPPPGMKAGKKKGG